jgi:enoyl-CoA hydratase
MKKNYSDKHLKIDQHGNVGIITLSNPENLNALTYNMITGLSHQLDLWADDDSIQVIIIEGEGDRAFCAGGNVKEVYEAGLSHKAGHSEVNKAKEYFFHEYTMNRKIYEYKKPLIALMDGIVMGGGYGVAGPCTFKIASNRTLFAMPEVAIGLFTDVGSTFFLNRCPSYIGYYLAVTGQRINGIDMVYSGLADIYIDDENIDSFKEKLIKTLQEKADPLEVINYYSEKYPKGKVLQENSFDKLLSLISRVFSLNSIDKIILSLQKENTEWADRHLEMIKKACPLSLKVTLRHMIEAQKQTFNEIILRDFILAQRFVDGTEFYEGVRALLIDKDKTPQWRPDKLSDVNDTILDNYFSPTGWGLDNIDENYLKIKNLT